MNTNARATLVRLLASFALLFSLNAHAGHAVCSRPAIYPEACPVNVDQKYMRVSAGSYNLCLERINYSLPPGSTDVLHPPAPAVFPPPPDPRLVNRVIARVDNVLTRTVALRNDLDQRLTQAVRRFAAQEGVSVSYAHGRVTGPISFSLQGQPNSDGALAIRIGLGIDMMAKGRKRGISGLIARGKITVRGSNLVFSATYNVNSGSISGLSLTGGPIHARFERTWLSFIRFRVDVDLDMAAYMSANSFTVFGLHSYIPTGAYVYNGTDYGLKIRRQLSNFVEDIDVTITQGGKHLSNAYLNVSAGDVHLTAGSIKITPRPAGGPRRPHALPCAPI